jgi:hypothetical protein
LPVFQDASGRRIENFTCVETFGDNAPNGNNDVHWVKVLVGAGSREIFAYQPQIVPGNRTAVLGGLVKVWTDGDASSAALIHWMAGGMPGLNRRPPRRGDGSVMTPRAITLFEKRRRPP